MPNQITGINWLAEYPKSGGTWVRAFLSAYEAGGTVHINELGNIGTVDSHSMWWQMHLPKPFDACTLLDMAMVRPAALYTLLQCWTSTGHYFSPIVKTHVARVQVCGIPMFPKPLTARVIYIVRDPRDVLVSSSYYFNSTFDEGIERMSNDDFVIGEDSVVQPLRSWSFHVKSWMQAKTNNDFPVLLVKYEDLLADPVQAFTRILKFLRWDIDDALVRTCVEATSFNKLKEMEARDGMVENRSRSDAPFFRTGGAGKYKDVLSMQQIERIEDDHAEVMDKLGYERTVGGPRNEADRSDADTTDPPELQSAQSQSAG